MNTDNSTPETVTIQLTQGQQTVVSADDADLAALKWHVRLTKSKGTEYYAVKRSSWIKGSNRNKGNRPVVMARVILERMIGRKLLKDEFVDHRDNNPLNNTRENLRLSDYWSNNRNAKRRIDNKSGYKGVCWDAKSNKWRAYINHNKVRYNLGWFVTPEEAYAAYCAKGRELHGEFFNPG